MQVLDLFSGIGGFSLGLERAGMKTIAFCEIDKKCQLVLKKHWPDVPIFDDIKTLTKDGLHERVDVICGGFPCQDISLAGKGAGLSGERSGLWSEFHRLINEIKPKYAIVENVAALRSRGLDQVLRSLASIEYDAQWHCIPASAIGAPHRRDRIWIIAYPNHAGSGASNSDTNTNWTQAQQEWKEQSFNRASGLREDVADTESQQDWRLQPPRFQSNPRTSGEGTDVCNANSSLLERQRKITERIKQELTNACNAGWWATEPAVGRVANGIPNRVHRLKQLGNSIVPQIAELLGKSLILN